MAVTNLQQFNRAMRNAGKKVPRTHLVIFQKKIAMEALRRIVMKTPVDTGRARGNWQVDVNNAPSSVLETTDKSGEGTIGGGVAAMAALPPFGTIWIVNNLPYIRALENGHSGQAPTGMVSVTLAELRGMFT